MTTPSPSRPEYGAWLDSRYKAQPIPDTTKTHHCTYCDRWGHTRAHCLDRLPSRQRNRSAQ